MKIYKIFSIAWYEKENAFMFTVSFDGFCCLANQKLINDSIALMNVGLNHLENL